MSDSDVIAREHEVDRAIRRARRLGLESFEHPAYDQTQGETRTTVLPWGCGYAKLHFRGDPDLDHLCTPPIFAVALYADKECGLLWAEELLERDFTPAQWRVLGEMLDEDLTAARARARFRRLQR